jgi:hypothetical protein
MEEGPAALLLPPLRGSKMSIEKTGNVNATATASISTMARHSRPSQARTDVKASSAVEKCEEKVDLTRITYPPFLPVGYTQTIFKEK